MKPHITKFKLLFFLAFSIPAVLRLLPWGRFVAPERTYFYGPDSYDHMRRVLLMVHSFPDIPRYNFYQGYPVGSTLFLAPLYDFLMACVAMAAGLGAPSERAVEMAGVVMPFVFAMAAVFMVYVLARELMGKGAALVSAFIFGTLPGYLYYSTVGQPDNNVVEPLVACLFFYLLLKALKEEPGGWAYAALASASGVFALLMWRGATVFWVIGLGTVLVARLFADKIPLHPPFPKGEEQEKNLYTNHAMVKAGAIFAGMGLVLMALAWSGFLAVRGVVSFREISYFHAVFASSMGLGLLSAYAVNGLAGRGPKIAGLAVEAVAFLVPSALSVALVPGFGNELLGAFGMMGQKDVWLLDNIEYQPMLFPKGGFDFIRPTLSLSMLFWLTPAAVLWSLWRLLRGKERQVEVSFLFVSTGVFLFSALSHLRFENLLAINVALTGGLLFDRFATHAGGGGRKAAVYAALAVMLAPSAYEAVKFSTGRMPVVGIQKGFMGTMDWIRENTPPTSHFMEPSERPEYGVMAEWSIGSWVENIARRPAVATNFGAEIHGLEESARFFLAASEAEAVEVLRRNNARYVIITNLIPSLKNYALVAGLPAGEYAVLKDGRWSPTAKYYDLVSTSLLLGDGVAPDDVRLPLKKLDHFRLLYESEAEMRATGLPRPVKKIKVFEYVEGALLEVAARPGLEVSVTATIRTNRMRDFQFKRAAAAGADGKAVFVLPYAPPAGPGATGLAGPYTVRAGERAASVEVSEGDVLMGEHIGISLR